MLVHQQLVGLVIGALQAAPALAGGHIYRHRARAVAADVPALITVRVLSSQSTAALAGWGAPVDWVARIALDCAARTGATQAPDEAVAPLLLAAHQRLVADTSLRDAGFDLEPDVQIDWDQEDLDERIGSALCVCTVRWRSPYHDLSTVSP